MDSDAVAAGQRVAGVRAHRGWSRRELARRAGLSATYISSFERGLEPRPLPRTLEAIARALGWRSFEALIRSDAPEPPAPPTDGGAPPDPFREELTAFFADMAARMEQLAQDVERDPSAARPSRSPLRHPRRLRRGSGQHRSRGAGRGGAPGTAREGYPTRNDTPRRAAPAPAGLPLGDGRRRRRCRRRPGPGPCRRRADSPGRLRRPDRAGRLRRQGGGGLAHRPGRPGRVGGLGGAWPGLAARGCDRRAGVGRGRGAPAAGGRAVRPGRAGAAGAVARARRGPGPPRRRAPPHPRQGGLYRAAPAAGPSSLE